MENKYGKFTNSDCDLEADLSRTQRNNSTGVPSISGENCSKSKTFQLGIVECILGGLCLIVGLIVLFMITMIEVEKASHHIWSLPCQGLWGGLLMLSTGRVAISVSRGRGKCFHYLHLILGGVTIVALLLMVVFSGCAAPTKNQSTFLTVCHGGLITLGVIGLGLRITLIALNAEYVGSRENAPQRSTQVLHYPQFTSSDFLHPTQTVPNQVHPVNLTVPVYQVAPVMQQLPNKASQSSVTTDNQIE